MICEAERALGAGAVHEAVEAVDAIAPRNEGEQQCAEHGDVAPRMSRHAQRAAIRADAAREHVAEHGEHRHDRVRQQRPGVGLQLEREPRRPEREVILEVRVRLAERARIEHVRKRNPVVDRHGEQHTDDEGTRPEHQRDGAVGYSAVELQVAHATRHDDAGEGTPDCFQVRPHHERRSGTRANLEHDRHRGPPPPDVHEAQRVKPRVLADQRAPRPPDREHDRDRDHDREQSASADHHGRRCMSFRPTRLVTAARR